MIIDGEELTFKCNECGHKFNRLIGYGPICSTPNLREKKLKENTTACPKCCSNDVHRLSILGRLLDFLDKIKA